MADDSNDNTSLPAVSGTVLATDNITNAASIVEVFQRVKLVQGRDGVNDGDVSKLDPMPTNDVAVCVLIKELITEIKINNLHLSEITNSRFTMRDIDTGVF